MGFHCQHLSKTYQTRNGSVSALDDITFSVGEHEFVCLIGPSGCGKTTLLKLIAGLLEPTPGQIIFNSPSPTGRPRSAMVFQEHGVFPWMTVLDNVAFGLEMLGVSRHERRQRALTFVERMGLRSFADSFPHELSVGMRQRVGIARAFLADPQLLLMDEPFGPLDAQTKLALQEELLKIWKEYQNSVVYVTHDIEEAVLLGDRVLVMSGWPRRIVEEIPIPLGRPRNLLDAERPEVKDIKWHLWRQLESDVRRSLGIAF
jgi:NitT/TauT family transport system ATP-binding protein